MQVLPREDEGKARHVLHLQEPLPRMVHQQGSSRQEDAGDTGIGVSNPRRVF